ncbi:helix-turn-helix domain-containing protein [Escherichia coli]
MASSTVFIQGIALIFDVGVSTIYRKFPANKINESP